MNINDVVAQIKSVGVNEVRVTTMEGQSCIDGDCQIDIRQSGAWNTILSGVKRTMAENIVRQSRDRVILG